MSALSVTLSRLRDDIPQQRRRLAEKRTLLEYHLRHEHAQLQAASSTTAAVAPALQSWNGSSQCTSSDEISQRSLTITSASFAAGAPPPARRCTLNTYSEDTNGNDGSSSDTTASSVTADEAHHREATTEHCSRDEVRQHDGDDSERQQQQQYHQLLPTSPAGHSTLQRYPYTTNDASQLLRSHRADEPQQNSERSALADSADRPRPQVDAHRVTLSAFFHEPQRVRQAPHQIEAQHFVAGPDPPRLPHSVEEEHYFVALPEPPRQVVRGNDERARRQVVIRQGFDAAGAPARGRDGGLVGARGGDARVAQRGGAPSFTVGGGGGSTIMGDGGGREWYDQQRVELRRVDLLRRILHAMRRSVRTRAAEEARALALPSPEPRDHYLRASESTAAGTSPEIAAPLPATPPTLSAAATVAAPRSFQRTLVGEGFCERAPPERAPTAPGARVMSPPSSPGDVAIGADLPGGPPVYPREGARTGSAHSGATIAIAEGLPVHPRQDARTETAHRAVFEALARLLPALSTEEVSRLGDAGGTVGAAAGWAGRMQAAALRCGSQCQGYIRSLQQGLQVTRQTPTGQDIHCELTLRSASTAADRSTGVTLVLRDIASPEAQARDNTVTNPPPPPPSGGAPVPLTLPLAQFSRVLCPKEETGGSLSFVILAVTPSGRCGSVPGRGRGRRRGRGRGGRQCRDRAVVGGSRLWRHEGQCQEDVGELLVQEEDDNDEEGEEKEEEVEEEDENDEEDEDTDEDESEEEEEGGEEEDDEWGTEVEPFGTLWAMSEEQLCALVLGVASAKSALGSPFGMRRVDTETVAQGQKFRATTTNPAGAESSTRPATPASSAPVTAATTTATTTATSTAAASAADAAPTACLPWQGARVCIAALAPSLTLAGAVGVVEAEARRAGREHGVPLWRQNLLICSDRSF